MRTRTFSEEEKEQIREQMMEAGLPLLKAYGMTHMSVTKLTKEAGIGKSTFYNFYESKEQFVAEMLNYHRRKLLHSFQEGLGNRKQYDISESKEWIRRLFSEENNVYQHFSVTDEMILAGYNQKKNQILVDMEKEKGVMDFLFSKMSGVRKHPDYAVISNLVKVIVLASEQKILLHDEGYERMKELLVENLLQKIFEE